MTRVRFAPSPTGHLHIGNLRTALVNYLYARKEGGAFMLRIDDTDDERSTKEYEDSIRADLKWMGLDWDNEARQSERLGEYESALQKLLADGRAYKCFETQEELALKRKAQLAAGRPPVYDRAALQLSDAAIKAREDAGERPHYRFKLSEREIKWYDMVRGDVTIPMSSLSDPVIMRGDGRVIYTLASVVDDLAHGTTHILRGEDHTTNSAAQIDLFEALGGAGCAPQMGHFALLVGKDGEGLSKRFGSLGIGAMREDGMEPVAIAALLARLGTADPVEPQTDMQKIIAGFDVVRFGRATPRFDMAELQSLNGRVLGMLEYDMVAARLDALGIIGGAAKDFWEAVRGNLTRFDEVAGIYAMATKPITPKIEDAALLDKAVKLFPECDTITAETWGAWTKALADATGQKGKALFRPLRLALTGEAAGPEMAGLLAVMGRERILARLKGETA